MKKAAEKTADIDMSKFQARKPAGVFDGQTPVSQFATEPPPPRKYTGVGSVMAALTRETEVSNELVAVRSELLEASSRLASFEGASVEQKLDPRSIARSKWANRDEAEFVTAEFRALTDEIGNAGGNTQPIKVRLISGRSRREVFDGQTPQYEIVFGHRRHRACLQLGLPVSALVVDQMSDQDLFEAMDRENRGRKNLSPWEQGRMYDDAIKQGLYSSIRKLTDKLGVNLSDASRAIQLARLPKEVVNSFASPLDLQVRWAKLLTDALQRDPDGVLSRARALQKEKDETRPAADTLNRLLGKSEPAEISARDVMSAGRKVATLKSDGKGGLLVQFENGVVPPKRHDQLIEVLAKFTGESK